MPTVGGKRNLYRKQAQPPVMDTTISPATHEFLRQIDLLHAKIITCDCAVMQTPNTNRKDQEALLQQCLTDLEMKIMDLEAEPE
jgi:hypothetical protein